MALRLQKSFSRGCNLILELGQQGIEAEFACCSVHKGHYRFFEQMEVACSLKALFERVDHRMRHSIALSNCFGVCTRKSGTASYWHHHSAQIKCTTFLGIVRMLSNCNTHPTPEQFALTAHCLCFYNSACSVAVGNPRNDSISSLRRRKMVKSTSKGWWKVKSTQSDRQRHQVRMHQKTRIQCTRKWLQAQMPHPRLCSEKNVWF